MRYFPLRIEPITLSSDVSFVGSGAGWILFLHRFLHASAIKHFVSQNIQFSLMHELTDGINSTSDSTPWPLIMPFGMGFGIGRIEEIKGHFLSDIQ